MNVLNGFHNKRDLEKYCTFS